MTVSPTFRPDFAAFPETPTTFRPPPGLFESPSLRPSGFSISICSRCQRSFWRGRLVLLVPMERH